MHMYKAKTMSPQEGSLPHPSRSLCPLARPGRLRGGGGRLRATCGPGRDREPGAGVEPGVGHGTQGVISGVHGPSRLLALQPPTPSLPTPFPRAGGVGRVQTPGARGGSLPGGRAGLTGLCCPQAPLDDAASLPRVTGQARQVAGPWCTLRGRVAPQACHSGP